MTKLRLTLNYSNVVATLALFLALGGSAWAALALGPNAVKTRNLAPSAVTSGKLAAGSVTKRKIGRRAVTARALGPGAVLPGALGIGSVTSAALGANSVTSADLANNSVTNAKIAANAVTGPKVDESTLDQVPNAQLFDGLTTAKVMRTDRFGRTKVASGSTATGATSTGIASFISNEGSLDFTCDAGLTFTFRNANAAAGAQAWTSSDGSPAVYSPIAASGSAAVPSQAGGSLSTGSIDWLVQTDNTLIKMTTVAQNLGAAGCAWNVYYEEVTLGIG